MEPRQQTDDGETALILFQTLICYLREKNVLTRADIEELRDRVESRAREAGGGIPCAASAAQAATEEMNSLTDYCGRRYGGRHRRST